DCSRSSVPHSLRHSAFRPIDCTDAQGSTSPRVCLKSAPSIVNSEVAMSQFSCPRLSEAKHLLPFLRSHLIAAAPRFPLSAGLTLELLPLVEDGLFGYELVPDRQMHTT
ncbi:MAG: hypothetical protein ACR2HE_08685, partial [Casimicrobiaceae bacterium]